MLTKGKFSKSIIMVLVLCMAVLTACGKKEETVDKGEMTTDGQTFKIGVIQIADHPALDNTRIGLEEVLKEKGIDFEIEYKNAQGEPGNVSLAVQSFVQSEVDLIYAIGTPAAQGAAENGADIPVLFNAVTDAVTAELVESNDAPNGIVTGVSDYVSSKSQLETFLRLFPEVKTMGAIFNTNEKNSEVQIDELIANGKELGIEVETIGINNLNDVSQAMASLVGKTDGLFAITDNLIASSAPIIGEILVEAGLPSMAAEEGPAAGGLLFSEGISYEYLGNLAGEMAIEILVNGKKPSEMPVKFAEETTLMVNSEVAEALGIDIKTVFADAVIIGE
ncbi:MAG: ABC transporter substrate-binding protein [Tissierellia bacterium]|nr:ABC transporter substrate-binding protein [Tissierellia bacterium]